MFDMSSIQSDIDSTQSGTVMPGRRTPPCKNYDGYFSDDEIIRELARQRVKIADRRNKTLFLRRISSVARRAKKESEEAAWICSIFPPRRLWHKYRGESQNRKGRSASDVNLDAILTAVRRNRRRSPKFAWVARLDEEICAIREAALGRDRTVKPPTVIAVEKNLKKREYRPLAVFGLRDKIIDVLTARYFRNSLDRYFHSSCLAFRASTKEQPSPTIHDALAAILKVRESTSDTLYVAECDIRSFFDCVSHAAAKNALLKLIDEAARDSGSPFTADTRAIAAFDAYLAAYSFEENVKSQETVLRQRHGAGASYPWPRGELNRLYQLDELPRIGVPQGGALSCFIANAMLHLADKRLEALKCLVGSFTYMRYCDDMIIIAKDRPSCEAAFAVYTKTLEDLRLPAHNPAPLKPYIGTDRKDFWNAKSKACYAWTAPNESGNAYPWIQFLGYQIRYDGLVRIRPKSLKKHKRKILNAVNDVLKLLDTPDRLQITTRQVQFRLKQQLVSFSVGRRAINEVRAIPAPMCWAYGFRGLQGKKIVEKDLRMLDRYRERQLGRVKKRLRILHAMIESDNQRFASRPQKAKGPKIRGPKYDGCPLSYFGQFSSRVVEHHSDRSGSAADE